MTAPAAALSGIFGSHMLNTNSFGVPATANFGASMLCSAAACCLLRSLFHAKTISNGVSFFTQAHLLSAW